MASKTTQDDARRELITVRTTTRERERLSALARARGTDVAEVLRTGANRIAAEEGRAHVFR